MVINENYTYSFMCFKTITQTLHIIMFTNNVHKNYWPIGKII